ncbi:MAG: CHAT domain-containing protein [bacterium]|nr:CHAT domain-containing protein [bacterium]
MSKNFLFFIVFTTSLLILSSYAVLAQEKERKVTKHKQINNSAQGDSKTQRLNKELFEEIKHYNLDYIKSLIEQGADVNTKDENDATVLMWAVYLGNVETVYYLIEQKADFNKKGVIFINEGKEGYYGNILGIAAGENRIDLLKYFIDILNVDIEDKEYNIKTKTDDGWTALQWAVHKKNNRIIKYLLKKGADESLCYAPRALNFYRKKDFKNAALKFEKAIPVIKAENGEGKYYAEILLLTASSYERCFNLNKAKQYYLSCRKIYKSLGAERETTYALCCNNLAGLYRKIGNFREAEPLYIEAQNIYKDTLGEISSSYATGCNNFAAFYQSIGNYQKAESLYIEAKNIFEKKFGDNHSHSAASYNNLAMLYCVMGEFKKAENLYMKAKKIYRNKYGKNHNNYAMSCNNLALLYENIGFLLKAEPLYAEAKKIWEKVLGKEHSSYALGCNNLAALYQKLGNYQKAEPLYLEAKNIYEKLFYKQHPDYALSCNNLAILYEKIGKNQKADSLYIEANNIINFLSKESEKFMTEKERENYLNNEINYNYDIYYSYFLKRSVNNKNTGLVYNNTLNLKGKLLKSSILLRKSVFQSRDSNLLNTFNAMNDYGKILAKQYALPTSQRRSDIKQIEEKEDVLKKELTRKSSSLSGLKNQTVLNAEWKDIQNSLQENEAAIEFIHFKYRNVNGQTDSVLYYALVLRKDFKYPKAVFLFEQKQFTKILQDSEYSFAEELYKPKSFGSDSLYNIIWHPIEKYLQNIKNIYISPSGLLNRVSFNALAYKENSEASKTNELLLIDKYKIIYTSSTIQVFEKSGLYPEDINNAVLFGGIVYDINVEEMETLASRTNKKSDLVNIVNSGSVVNTLFFDNYLMNNPLSGKNIDSLYRNLCWRYLPGTLEEVEEIQDVLDNKSISSTIFKDKFGSEEKFKALESKAPSILHVSTHGFYFGSNIEREKGASASDAGLEFMFSGNPLLRSGLILSGGNAVFKGEKIPEGVEDGVITALEISRMNLFDTKLAVLSACQTGLGDVEGNEGVYGLQRSFKMAGVDYLLFSLWEVPDKQTKELMVTFYKNWFSGMEIRDAFKNAQNKLKLKYADDKNFAYVWAAFILMK